MPFREEAERTETAHVKVECNRRGEVLAWRLLQPRTHGLMMMHVLELEDFARNKDCWIDKKPALEFWWSKWSEHVNTALKRAGRSEQVDHRTRHKHGKDRKPQRGG